jgi:hypothetical protein
VFGHLFALVPGEGTAQLLRQAGDRFGQGVVGGFAQHST